MHIDVQIICFVKCYINTIPEVLVVTFDLVGLLLVPSDEPADRDELWEGGCVELPDVDKIIRGNTVNPVIIHIICMSLKKKLLVGAGYEEKPLLGGMYDNLHFR